MCANVALINYFKKGDEMVSKSIIILSLSMPLAMVIGTSIAIEFYKNSIPILLILYALGGLMMCVYIIVQQSDSHRMSYKKNIDMSNLNEQT